MSGFSTHPIVPSLFKDMKDPSEFCKMLNWAYAAATVIYLSMGICGYLMFGNSVSDEITRDLANNKGFPRVLNTVAIWLIIINPLSKFALAARPINTTLELILGVEKSQINASDHRENPPRKTKYGSLQESHSPVPSVAEAVAQVQQDDGRTSNDDSHLTPRLGGTSSSTLTIGREIAEEFDHQHPEQSPLAGSTISLRAAQRTANWSRRSKVIVRIGVHVAITVAIGLTAIMLPGFEKVMAFLGSFLACVTCIFGPLLANLRSLHHEMSRFNIIMDCFFLVVFAAVAAIGTVWSFLPLS
jgi:vesicular inhibitory amino acid transporter